MNDFARLTTPPLTALALLLTIPLSVSAGGGAVTTTTFTSVGSLQISLNGAPAVSTIYVNNSNSTVLGIVYIVVRNSIGQTVYYSTGTLNLNASQTAPAFLPIVGLASGSYNATIFALDPDNVAISTASSIYVTI